jgi:hypothetical protein
MLLIVDEDYIDDLADPAVHTEMPARYEVCPDCEGKGRYVNPAIDSHGISPEEFAEDPDFAESYHRGLYDIPCRSCGGRRVILVPIHGADNKAIDDLLQAEFAYQQERAAEIRMGA